MIRLENVMYVREIHIYQGSPCQRETGLRERGITHGIHTDLEGLFFSPTGNGVGQPGFYKGVERVVRKSG